MKLMRLIFVRSTNYDHKSICKKEMRPIISTSPSLAPTYTNHTDKDLQIVVNILYISLQFLPHMQQQIWTSFIIPFQYLNQVVNCETNQSQSPQHNHQSFSCPFHFMSEDVCQNTMKIYLLYGILIQENPSIAKSQKSNSF